MANWDRITSRGNVQDRRSAAPLLGGLGLGGVALFVAINLLLGGDINDVLSSLLSSQVSTSQNLDTSQFEGEDEYEVFAEAVLGSANDHWRGVFEQLDEQYTEPTLVLFRTATQSSCGTASSQIGPHYCPVDNTIYLDETFFDELTRTLGAEGGDVAEAYVIAHEVGHHVQNELGIMDVVRSREDNDELIALELQADCYAGLWAHSVKDLGVFNPGEIEEAMDAAAVVGDDHIQEVATGDVNPETWTHGSSRQRVNAFTKGFEQGDFNACALESF